MRDDIPAELRLEIGEQREIALSSLGAAGYQWTVAPEPPHGCVEVTLGGVKADGEAGEPSSGGIQELLVVRAVASGEAMLDLRQLRTWAAGEAPLRSHRIHVVVAGAEG